MRVTASVAGERTARRRRAALSQPDALALASAALATHSAATAVRRAGVRARAREVSRHAFTPARDSADGVRRRGRRSPARRGRGGLECRSSSAPHWGGRSGDAACTATARSRASSSPSASRRSNACPATPRPRSCSRASRLDRYLASVGDRRASRERTRARAQRSKRAATKMCSTSRPTSSSSPELPRRRRSNDCSGRRSQRQRGSTLVATLHGLTIASPELASRAASRSPTSTRCRAARGCSLGDRRGSEEDHLLVVHTVEDDDAREALIARGDVIRSCSRAAVVRRRAHRAPAASPGCGWAGGSWTPLCAGAGGRAARDAGRDGRAGG